MVITRIPPSPSGFFHIGSARTAYVNYLEARSQNGKFIMRCDDSDLERSKQEYIDIISDSMNWLGLEYDEFYQQSKRFDIYLKLAEDMIKAGTANRLENGAIALNSELFWSRTSFHDQLAGEISITDTNRDQTKNLILIRGGEKQDQPIYHFCSVVDDYLLGVNHIIRGVDHISNTPKQIMIWDAINQTLNQAVSLPKFSHIGLIFKDKKKLSKRDGAASLLDYRNEGYSSEALNSWFLLLGWSLKVPRGDKQMEKIANAPIDKQAAIELFQQGSLKNTPSNFSIDKLNSLQKYYARTKK